MKGELEGDLKDEKDKMAEEEAEKALNSFNNF